MNEINPTYLEADFSTLKSKLISVLKASDTFKDYNFEGANITMLIELLSYLSEMNVYYVNKLAKNMFLDTTEVYETSSSMANLRGYYPKGYVAAKTKLTVTIPVHEYLTNIPNPGDQIYIPQYFSFPTGLQYNEEDVKYITTSDYTFTVPPTAVDFTSFEIELKQGIVETLSYTGEDIINNVIYLPFYSFDHDTQPYDETSSIVLYVNGEPWTRVDNFVDEYSNIIDNDKVYRFEYNKFQQYCIRFSTAHTTPKSIDQIKIFAIKTMGENGDVSSFTITKFDNTQNVPQIQDGSFAYTPSYFVKNITKDYGVNLSGLTIENRESSYGSSNPETIKEIYDGSTSVLQSQYRNVTKNDYNNYLEEHQDIVKANSWGESEVNPYNTTEYNKIYISVIPTVWSDSTITAENTEWTITPGLSANINVPDLYSDIFVSQLKNYLEPKKYLNTFETFVLPDLVYFTFSLGVRIKRLYNFTNVKNDLEAKLNYYFRTSNMDFNKIVDFKDIHNYIMDTSQKSPTNSFSSIKGIENLIIREITTFTPSITAGETTIFEPNDDKDYPQYTKEVFDGSIDNALRPIKLGFNQFPVLLTEGCIFNNEV